jgi:hypothetical protein
LTRRFAERATCVMAGQIGVCGPEGKVGGRQRRYRARDGLARLARREAQ